MSGIRREFLTDFLRKYFFAYVRIRRISDGDIFLCFCLESVWNSLRIPDGIFFCFRWYPSGIFDEFSTEVIFGFLLRIHLEILTDSRWISFFWFRRNFIKISLKVFDGFFPVRNPVSNCLVFFVVREILEERQNRNSILGPNV